MGITTMTSENEIRINLGAGAKPLPGWINYDKNPLMDTILPLDLETDTIPHEDHSVLEIYMKHVLEHINNIGWVMNECHRVLGPGGQLVVEVPRFPHEDAIADPTHVRFFVPETFRYFEHQATTKMYGYKPWRVVYLDEESDKNIVAILRPEK